MEKYKQIKNNLQKHTNQVMSLTKEDLPTWNSQIPYVYESQSDNPDENIENSTSTLSLDITYNNLSEPSSWDKYQDRHIQFVKETHRYVLTFENFDDIIHGEYDENGPSYICKRNINGTYTKHVTITVNVKHLGTESSTEQIVYDEQLTGEFKSFDFDFKTCRLPNDTLFRKTVCFLNETLISSNDPYFNEHDDHSEPDYALFFKEDHCLAHLFTNSKQLNTFQARPNINNKPDDKWTYYFIEGYRDGTPFVGVRAIGMKKTSDNTADLLIDDIRNINKQENESISKLTFKGNKAIGVHDDDTVVTIYTFDHVDPTRKIKSLQDIDTRNLQNYIITCVNTIEGSDVYDDNTRCEMTPGFVYTNKCIL